MKQQNLLTKMLLLFALVVGSVSSVWADAGDEITTVSEIVSGKSYYLKGVYTSSKVDYTVYYGPSTDEANTKVETSTVTDIAKAMPVKFTKVSTGWVLQTPNGNYIRPHSSNGQSYLVADEFILQIESQATKAGNGMKFGPYNTNYYIQQNTTASKIGAYSSSQRGLTLIEVAETSSDPSSEATFGDATPSIDFPGTKTYSQVATTATGYTGTVTYEITANTAGATISGSTVTVTQEGSVTVKATAPAIEGSFAESTATYTLTVNDTRRDNGLAFAESSQDVQIGSILTAPTLTNPHNLAVTYSSDDTNIATVDASGNVTGVAAGTTTITASFEGDNVYKAGSASYTINVTDPTWIDLTAQGYKNADDVTTVEGLNGTLTFDLGTNSNGNKPKWYDSGSAVRLYTGNTIKITVKTGYVLTSVEFSVTSGSMSADNFSETVTQVGKTNKFILTNPASEITYSASANFRIDKVKLTLAKATITLASACTNGTNYFGTYSNESAFVVPEDLTVSAVSVSGGKLTVTNYATGDIVKAGTGVMVSSATAGDHTVLLSSETGTEISGNMLKGSGAGITAEEMSAENTTFYRLTMHNGTQIGFWWGAENGAAFSLAANKAYLAVPESASAPALGFEFGGDTTGISQHLTPNTQQQIYYDLSGRRVAQPTKGVFIVNGKKVLVK